MSRPPVDPADPMFSQQEPDPDRRQEAAGPARPAGVLVVATVVAIEATALMAAAGWYGFQLAIGSPVLSFWGAVFTLALLIAFSAWLYAVAVFHYRGFRWTRAAALVAQLFAMTIGIPTLTGGLLLPGLAMLIPAAAAIVLLFQDKVIAFASRSGNAPPTL